MSFLELRLYLFMKNNVGWSYSVLSSSNLRQVFTKSVVTYIHCPFPVQIQTQAVMHTEIYFFKF